jgi:mercuric ion binding protein
MKKNVMMVALLLLVCSFTFAQKPTQIKVSGNCGSCKKHIEKAAMDAGATTATWDKTTKLLALTFDANKTNTDKIETAIAGVGYDTEHKVATEEAYKKLDECCQYDRKKKK